MQGITPLAKKLCWPAGQGTGVVAPNKPNCCCVNRPADTKACPAGVSWPALLLSYPLMKLFRVPALRLRPNEPTLEPGTTSPVVPSP
jgi:hypothetical protein